MRINRKQLNNDKDHNNQSSSYFCSTSYIALLNGLGSG